MNIKYDVELITKLNQMDLLKEGLDKKIIRENFENSFGRNLIHECCIFGNFSMLQYLVSIWGEEMLRKKDKFGVTATHLAARNGNSECRNDLYSYLIKFQFYKD